MAYSFIWDYSHKQLLYNRISTIFMALLILTGHYYLHLKPQSPTQTLDDLSHALLCVISIHYKFTIARSIRSVILICILQSVTDNMSRPLTKENRYSEAATYSIILAILTVHTRVGPKHPTPNK